MFINENKDPPEFLGYCLLDMKDAGPLSQLHLRSLRFLSKQLMRTGVRSCN